MMVFILKEDEMFFEHRIRDNVYEKNWTNIKCQTIFQKYLKRKPIHKMKKEQVACINVLHI